MPFDPSALPGDNPVGQAPAGPAPPSGTTIEIWRSVTGISPEDFSLLATVPDSAPPNVPFYSLDTPVVPGRLYIYKARRLSQNGLYSPFSAPVFARGPWPTPSFNLSGNTPMSIENPTTNVGFNSKIGIGVEPLAGSLVQAGRLLHRVSGSLVSNLSLIEQQTIRNHPGVIGFVRGVSKIGGGLLLEITPESDDELLSSFFGAPVTTGVAGPPAPTGPPTAAVVGTPGAATLSYTLIARSSQGDSVASQAATVTTANATLTNANYVQLSWNAVPGATSYVVLKGTAILGVVYGLSLQDTGQATSGVYAAPGAGTGNVQTWKNGLAMLPVSLSELRGASVFAYGGCQGSKLSIKFDKTQSTPLQMTAEMMALYELVGYTQSQLGLNTAGFDPLGDYGVAPSTVCYFAGQAADCKSFDADIDNNLGEKHTLSGFIGPNGFYKQENKAHSFKATLYFSSEAEYQRYFGLASAPTGPYGAGRSIIYFPISIVTTSPANAAGIVNQFILTLPYATYRTVGAPIKDKSAIMQDVELGAAIDPVSGTDIIVQVANSRSNANIITPGSLVTPVPANAAFPYVA